MSAFHQVVEIKGPLYLVVSPSQKWHLEGRIGDVYADKESALNARDPGEIVVELRLAHQPTGNE